MRQHSNSPNDDAHLIALDEIEAQGDLFNTLLHAVYSFFRVGKHHVGFLVKPGHDTLMHGSKVRQQEIEWTVSSASPTKERLRATHDYRTTILQDEQNALCEHVGETLPPTAEISGQKLTVNKALETRHSGCSGRR